jgi:hypothetical protein
MVTVGSKVSATRYTSVQNVQILKDARTLKAVKNGIQKGATDMPLEAADLKMVVPINTKSQPQMKILNNRN